MKTATNQYIPGVCNIGPAEITKRRQLGWIGLIATIVSLVLLILLNASKPTRLIVFLPVALSSSGFLQAYLHFCAGFGSQGLYNFDSKVGKADSVDQAEFRAKDRRKALQIFGGSAAIGLVVAIASVLL
jgi:hypothetical protein